jgi:hypothetical protein
MNRFAENAGDDKYFSLLKRLSPGDVQEVLRSLVDDEEALEQLAEDLRSGPMFDLGHAGLILREKVEDDGDTIPF